jgi:hypothetical protein
MKDSVMVSRKKTGLSNMTNPSLVSPDTPTLASPIRGFTPQINTSVIQTAPDVVSSQTPSTDEQVLKSEALKRLPLGHDISRISLRPQARLNIGQPGDMYEQEADMMANRVMSMPLPALQREPMLEEEEEEVQAKLLNASIQREIVSEEVQTKPSLQRATDDSLQASDNIESRLNTSKGGGSPLPDEVRGFMEPRFGHDFSKVRVHTGGDAVQMNRELGAQAFAHGSDIYFGAGKAPAKDALTAHELTHVVQQGVAAETAQRQLVVSNAPSQVMRDDPPTTAAAPEPDPGEIWRQIETRAIPELLIKLQEIGRAASGQTKQQINDLFSSYEDSLESDQTFLSLMSIPLGGGGNMPQGGGTKAEAAGGLAGAAAAAAQFGMAKIMDFKSVGKVKEQANASIGDSIAESLNSDSSLYISFESEALAELRTEFDTSWAAMTPEAKSVGIPMITSTYVSWFQMTARAKYGTKSAKGLAALSDVRNNVSTQLVPIKPKLEALKDEQLWRRTGAGALGGATAGALIGGALGAGVFSLPGAAIGGLIGGAVGAIGGYFW